MVADKQPRQARVSLEGAVAERAAAGDRLVDEAAACANSPISGRASPRSGNSSIRSRPSGGAIAARRRRFAAAGMSPRAKARRPPSRGAAPRAAELASVVVERAELEQVAPRLLEVVAEDLLVLRLAAALAVDALGPVGESPWRSTGRASGRGGRRRPGRGCAGTGTCRSVARDRGGRAARATSPASAVDSRRLLGQERPDRARAKPARSPTPVRPTARSSSVRSRGGRRAGRRSWREGEPREVGRRDPRDRPPAEHSVVDEHRDHLLDVERVALGGLDDPARASAESVARRARRRPGGHTASSPSGPSRSWAAPSISGQPGCAQRAPGGRCRRRGAGTPRPVAMCSSRSSSLAPPSGFLEHRQRAGSRARRARAAAGPPQKSSSTGTRSSRRARRAEATRSATARVRQRARAIFASCIGRVVLGDPAAWPRSRRPART